MWGEVIDVCVNLLMELLYAFVVYEYFKTFFERKAIRGIYFYIFIINVCVQFIENSIPNYPDYCRLLTTIVTLYASGCFYNGKRIAKIVYILLFETLSMLAELIIACIFVAYNIESSLYDLGYSITYAVLFGIIVILQYVFRHSMYDASILRTNVKMMIIPIGSMFLAYCIFYSQYEMGIRGFYWRTIISIIILLSINIMMFNIFVKLSENLELKRKASIYEKEFTLLEQYMHERENLMKEFRVKRHDLKHQMLNLLILLQDQDYKKLEENIEELAELDSLNGLFVVNTENSIIDAFVNSKYAFATERGIKFDAKLNIPAELPFAGEDISVILGNALDNALEACLRGKVDDPYVKLNMSYDQGNLVILVENTFDGFLKKERKTGWATRKNNSQQHGIGIQSIRNVIQKYHGYYHVDIEEKVYRLEMVLYPQEK